MLHITSNFTFSIHLLAPLLPFLSLGLPAEILIPVGAALLRSSTDVFSRCSFLQPFITKLTLSLLTPLSPCCIQSKPASSGGSLKCHSVHAALRELFSLSQPAPGSCAFCSPGIFTAIQEVLAFMLDAWHNGRNCDEAPLVSQHEGRKPTEVQSPHLSGPRSFCVYPQQVRDQR